MKRRTHGLTVGDVAFAVLPDGRVRVLTGGGVAWYPSLAAFIASMRAAREANHAAH